MNDLLRLMAEHRSVRRFLSEPVPDERIHAAVQAAEMAATSSWIQAYALIQVTDASERVELAELCGGQRQVAEAGAFFCVCADSRRHELIAARAGVPREVSLETFVLGLVDASLFAQNLTLAFESLGYGCCYIGGLRNRLPEVDALLEIPSGVMPLYGLCVGFPDPGSPGAPRARLPVEAVWMKDRYLPDEAVLAHVDAMDEAAAREYTARGLAGRNWSGGVWRKFAGPARVDLAPYYRSKGARFS